ncbi:hypothetical protein [Bradyrhizobium cenepequi]
MLRIVVGPHGRTTARHKVSYIFAVHGQPVPRPGRSNREAIKNTNSSGITAYFSLILIPITQNEFCKASGSRPNCQGTGHDQTIDVVSPLRAAVLGAVLLGAQ